ncbi:zinc-binding oxidoreductase CipB [Truncatella angustata]|uniref:Zinc-binding oxidoreductase CipB n=1 Tax=Truncatella angustata TaxID=152316 RepID=A0A9P9A3H4_9PEZI|nr:zinc-binding oxidoreductase CipB [Truncatella angustata]KAH6658939.1 zinc-binding oxidoreductase CipB [Truncatella angustata]KAH8196243.1 hypothetical protein TruAng_009600 [Truncatella angustata]
MAHQNHAAYLAGAKVRPFEVKTAPYTPPGPNEIVIKNGAVAVNPVDLGKQVAGNNMFGWIKYPFILGSDVAGEVVEVGPEDAGSSFKPGDRVLGHAVAMDKRSNKASEGAYQEYTVLRTNLTAKIPDQLSYEQACVLPLCLSTAACGLFLKDYLGLQYPTASSPPTAPLDVKRDREVVVIWGGSTAVGSNAIQLATAAGYDVFTTASPNNFDYVKSLGAVQALDYRAADTVQILISALKGRTCAGALAIGNGSLEACIDVVASSSNGRKFVAQASIPLDPTKMPKNPLALMGVMLRFLWWNILVFMKSKVKRVRTKFIWGSDLMANELGKVIYKEFLPVALASGQYQAKPDARVVGQGLGNIQEALDVMSKGVSTTKIVVTL